MVPLLQTGGLLIERVCDIVSTSFEGAIHELDMEKGRRT